MAERPATSESAAGKGADPQSAPAVRVLASRAAEWGDWISWQLKNAGYWLAPPGDRESLVGAYVFVVSSDEDPAEIADPVGGAIFGSNTIFARVAAIPLAPLDELIERVGATVLELVDVDEDTAAARLLKAAEELPVDRGAPPRAGPRPRFPGAEKSTQPRQGEWPLAFWGHAGIVPGLCAGLLGGRPVLVSGGRDRSVRVWDAESGEELRVLTGHKGVVRAVALVELDGRPRIVSAGGGDRAVRIWDPESGEEIGRLEGHKGQVHAVAVAEFGGRPVIVSGAADHTVRAWDPVGGRPVAILEGHDGVVYALATLSYQGRPTIISGGADGTIRIWSLESGEAIARAHHDAGVLGVAVREIDGSLLIAAGAMDGAVLLWHASDPARLSDLTRIGRHEARVHTVAFVDFQGLPVVVSGGLDDDAVHAWDADSGEEVATLSPRGLECLVGRVSRP